MTVGEENRTNLTNKVSRYLNSSLIFMKPRWRQENSSLVAMLPPDLDKALPHTKPLSFMSKAKRKRKSPSNTQLEPREQKVDLTRMVV
jgi:hypothetical protein